MKLTLGQIADWIHAEGEWKTETEVFGYSIDSRTVGAGELFFAVTGERFDGHEFVETALAAGAAAAVVSMHWLAPDTIDPLKLLRVLESEDCVLRALQQLAHKVRMHWGGRVIGVTGSAGKTTTKEMIAQVLSAKFNVLKSAGNLNNHFGVPLQLLRLCPEHEVAVIEMGMNHAGEITRLAEISAPNWGVVSNVAPVHLEHFADGMEGIARAKYELIASLPKDGVAFLNGDDERVKLFGKGRTSRMYGLGEGVDVHATEVENDGLSGMRFTVIANGESVAAQIALMGVHNVMNTLAATAVGLESGMSLQECVDAAAGMQPGDKRGQTLLWHGAQIVNDCYNSNPKALNAMVDALMSVKAKRHIVVAGEMLELGPEAAAMHAECGAYMASQHVDVVVGVRGNAASLVSAAKEAGVAAEFFASPEEAGAWMKTNLAEGDAVLLKASRGVRLEKALTGLEA